LECNKISSRRENPEYVTVLKEIVRTPGTNGQKPPTEAGFPVPTSEMAG
jgi:hypothetical protein